MDSAGGPGLMQMLAQLQGGGVMPQMPSGGPIGMPPGMMGDAEGEGGNPLIQMLLAMFMGQGGGQGMPPATAGGGMPMGGGY